MSAAEEEETPVKMEVVSEPPKETVTSVNSTGNNENYVVLDTIAGESEESDKEILKEDKEEEIKEKKSEEKEVSVDTEQAEPPPAAETTSNSKDKVPSSSAANPRVRKKPKAPVVDVNSLRKRKWQLKVYPLHADDLQLSYVSILCKLASESLLYIPSEGRAGKAELYVATQKETAAIIGKLLRMEFHHQLLSIEVVRKDTGGKEDDDDSKKECKAYLMFDKFLSKKIFDAKGEKGSVVEKLVTLNKLPKAATKDFIGALFPFATEIEIIESDDPAERKATVKCKTPVTSLLVYKSFKRLEINDVHVKLSVDDSVKAIKLPPLFFGPPPDKKDNGPPDSLENLNKSSLPTRRPLITPLNRRVQQIRKRAILLRKKPTRGEMMRGQRGMPLLEDPTMGRRPLLGNRMPDPRMLPDPMRNRGMDMGYPGGPGDRRRMNDRQGRRTRERDSMERRARRGHREEGSTVTKEMLQLQNQLNQAIKNQIAMLNTSQGSAGGPPRGGMDHFPPAGSHRAPLLGHGPRHHYGEMGAPVNQHHTQEYGGGSWSEDMGRMERPERQMERERMTRGDRMERPNRGDRKPDRPVRTESRPERMERTSRDRSEKRGDSGRVKERSHGGAMPGLHSADPSRNTSRSARGADYTSSGRSSQRNESSFANDSHTQSNNSGRFGDYNSEVSGENGSYYRRY